MIDLHVHSLMSDGTVLPKDIASLAKAKGIEAFALTDHDTICGNKEAAIGAKQCGIEFINGMEMTLAYDNHLIHVVALGFDENHPAFLEYYTNLRERKMAAIESVVNYLVKRGVDISLEKIRAYSSGDGIDKYSVMRYLVIKESVKGSVQGLWDKYIDPAYRDLKIRENPSAEYALARIHAAGGVTSLAHFHKRIGLLGYTRAEQEEHIKYLHNVGLDGMEAYYPNYSEDDRAFADYLIKKYELLPTGGTDFHGRNRPGVELGTGINNNMNVPYSFYENICKRIKQF